MSSAGSEVYINGAFSEPMSAQHNFANTFDMADPVEAMSQYARVMHQHTKTQLDLAAQSARRRSGSDSPPRSGYRTERSSGSASISSTDS